MPLTDAVVENSFDFLEGSRAFGWILWLVPDGLDRSARDAYLVLCIAVLIILGRIGKLVLQYVSRLIVTARNERYRVKVGQNTFGRVLTFGRQYFDGHAIGRIDPIEYVDGWETALGNALTANEIHEASK